MRTHGASPKPQIERLKQSLAFCARLRTHTHTHTHTTKAHPEMECLKQSLAAFTQNKHPRTQAAQASDEIEHLKQSLAASSRELDSLRSTVADITAAQASHVCIRYVLTCAECCQGVHTLVLR